VREEKDRRSKGTNRSLEEAKNQLHSRRPPGEENQSRKASKHFSRQQSKDIKLSTDFSYQSSLSNFVVTCKLSGQEKEELEKSTSDERRSSSVLKWRSELTETDQAWTRALLL